MLTLEQWTSILGIIAGLFFVSLNIKSQKTLLGSFFKVYYRYLVTASILFSLGWLTEFFDYLSITSIATAEAIHHALLLLSAILFAGASYYFPKEATKLMK